jgi:hypothetical protein
MPETGLVSSRASLAGGVALVVVLLVTVLPVGAAVGQPAESPPAEPSLATLEEQLEQAFAGALSMSDRDDVEPMNMVMGWGTVMMSVTMLEHRRAQLEGRAPDAEGAQEALLERWAAARPGSAGPELFRLFRVENQAARLPGVLGLAARHPDDPLVLSHAGMLLRSFGRTAEAGELLEAHAERHPEKGSAWRLLAEHYGSLQNETRVIGAVRRWAEAAPDDPTLIEGWTSAGLDRVDPEATARLIERFLEQPHDRAEALEVCGRLARAEGSPHRAAARRCVVRFAAGAPSSSAASGEPSDEPGPGAEASAQMAEQTRERAIGLLAELAAAEGDWSSLLESLETLEPAARGRALVASARRIEAPAQCSERIELLRAALTDVGSDISTDANADGTSRQSIASAVRGCEQRPAAQDLFLGLLEGAPPEQVPSVLGAWVSRVNGVVRGEVPAGTASLLEARLERDPAAGELYRALATVYELEGEAERRFELLSRWSERAPESMRAQEATDLAWELAASGETEAAVALLEDRLARAFSPQEAELLWQILAEPAVPADAEWPDEAAWLEAVERADRWVGELIASGDPYRAAFGHVLAARGALLRGDAASAERHYLEAVRSSEHPRDEWVTEMMSALADSAGAERLAEIALAVCELTPLQQRHRGRDACATTLLARSGNAEAVSKLAEATGAPSLSEALPEDEPSLTSLAFAVQDSDPELAERAWRRLLELDPMDEGVWGNYAAFLDRQGRHEEVEALLPLLRERFEEPSSHLLRTVARARLGLGRPEGSIDLLEEARAALPAGANPAWIDAELREAHAAIGRRERAARASRSGRARTPTPPSLLPLTAEEQAKLAERVAGAADARTLLAIGEALRTGTPVAAGQEARYDPVAARGLFERAAASGDALAAYRLAIERRLGADAVPAAEVAAVETLARGGDAYARYLLGTGALLGVGRARDVEEARRWLELAAQDAEAAFGATLASQTTPSEALSWAHHNLAWMAERGEGLEQDVERAIAGYRRAGDLVNVVSLYDFARLTLNGYDSDLCRDGLARLERAAAAGHVTATAQLGKVLLYGTAHCATPDAERARPWLERASEGADLGARYDLGLLLLLSSGEEDAARGRRLLEEAVEQRTLLAVETLHLAYASGAFAPRDPARARALRADAARLGSDGLLALGREARYPPGRRLLEEAMARLEGLVAAGDDDAQPLLAAILLEGPHDLRDAARGARLARDAGAADDGWALRLLAGAFEQGDGVEADPIESLRTTRAAAEAGDPFAMFDLSVALMSGERIEPDLEAGTEWLTRAAETGHWQAVGGLARLYAEGRPGLPARPELAAPWKRRRAELGDDEALGWLIAHGYDAP